MRIGPGGKPASGHRERRINSSDELVRCDHVIIMARRPDRPTRIPTGAGGRRWSRGPKDPRRDVSGFPIPSRRGRRFR